MSSTCRYNICARVTTQAQNCNNNAIRKSERDGTRYHVSRVSGLDQDSSAICHEALSSRVVRAVRHATLAIRATCSRVLISTTNQVDRMATNLYFCLPAFF